MQRSETLFATMRGIRTFAIILGIFYIVATLIISVATSTLLIIAKDAKHRALSEEKKGFNHEDNF